MNGKKAKRLREFAKSISPLEKKDATIVKVSGAKRLELDAAKTDGIVRGKIIGGNRVLDGNCVRKIHRTLKRKFAH